MGPASGSWRQHLPAEVDTPVLTTVGLWGMFFFTPYAARQEPLNEWGTGGSSMLYKAADLPWQTGSLPRGEEDNSEQKNTES